MKPTQTSTPSPLFVSRIQRTTVQNLQAMPQRESVRFTSSSVKIPIFYPLHHHHLCDSSIHLFSDPESLPQIPNYSETHFAIFRHTQLHKSHQEVKHFAELINTQKKATLLNLKNEVNHFINLFKIQSRACPFNPRNAIEQFVVSLRNQERTKPFNPNNAFEHFLNFFKSSKGINPSFPALSKSSLLCSATLALTQSDDNVTVAQPKSGGGLSSSRHDEERVLISEVLVRNKDGEALERKDLENEAVVALKACRPNSALTVREVQEDVHRIVASGYFCSCMPVAVDTRDGIRLVFQVEPNQEFQGLVCEGANVLPLKFVEDAFRNGYGKVVNIRRLDEVINSINGWYMERGLFGMVSDVEILSGGIIRLQVSEAEVNNISIRFLDKTGEPIVGNTKPETIFRQLTTKKGQVYSMLQGKRDVDTVLAMGIMEDVSIIPQPARDTGKVDLTMNVVQRKNLGISAGGGISSGITSGPLAGLIGSCAIYRRNLFGRNQKLNLSVERGQIDSIFRLNYIDPWIEGDDKRTSRSIMIQGIFLHMKHLLLVEPSVRGYEEGAVGSGRSYVVSSGEISFPLLGRVEGAMFADYGTDLGSGPTVPGDPAGARLKAGSGFGYGIGVRVDSPLGPLRLEYAFNDQRTGRFHFGVGLRN